MSARSSRRTIAEEEGLVFRPSRRLGTPIVLPETLQRELEQIAEARQGLAEYATRLARLLPEDIQTEFGNVERMLSQMRLDALTLMDEARFADEAAMIIEVARAGLEQSGEEATRTFGRVRAMLWGLNRILQTEENFIRAGRPPGMNDETYEHVLNAVEGLLADFGTEREGRAGAALQMLSQYTLRANALNVDNPQVREVRDALFRDIITLGDAAREEMPYTNARQVRERLTYYRTEARRIETMLERWNIEERIPEFTRWIAVIRAARQDESVEGERREALLQLQTRLEETIARMRRRARVPETEVLELRRTYNSLVYQRDVATEEDALQAEAVVSDILVEGRGEIEEGSSRWWAQEAAAATDIRVRRLFNTVSLILELTDGEATEGDNPYITPQMYARILRIASQPRTERTPVSGREFTEWHNALDLGLLRARADWLPAQARTLPTELRNRIRAAAALAAQRIQAGEIEEARRVLRMATQLRAAIAFLRAQEARGNFAGRDLMVRALEMESEGQNGFEEFRNGMRLFNLHREAQDFRGQYSELIGRNLHVRSAIARVEVLALEGELVGGAGLLRLTEQYAASLAGPAMRRRPEVERDGIAAMQRALDAIVAGETTVDVDGRATPVMDLYREGLRGSLTGSIDREADALLTIAQRQYRRRGRESAEARTAREENLAFVQGAIEAARERREDDPINGQVLLEQIRAFLESRGDSPGQVEARSEMRIAIGLEMEADTAEERTAARTRFNTARARFTLTGDLVGLAEESERLYEERMASLDPGRDAGSAPLRGEYLAMDDLENPDRPPGRSMAQLRRAIRIAAGRGDGFAVMRLSRALDQRFELIDERVRAAHREEFLDTLRSFRGEEGRIATTLAMWSRQGLPALSAAHRRTLRAEVAGIDRRVAALISEIEGGAQINDEIISRYTTIAFDIGRLGRRAQTYSFFLSEIGSNDRYRRMMVMRGGTYANNAISQLAQSDTDLRSAIDALVNGGLTPEMSAADRRSALAADRHRYEAAMIHRARAMQWARHRRGQAFPGEGRGSGRQWEDLRFHVDRQVALVDELMGRVESLEDSEGLLSARLGGPQYLEMAMFASQDVRRMVEARERARRGENIVSLVSNMMETEQLRQELRAMIRGGAMLAAMIPALAYPPLGIPVMLWGVGELAHSAVTEYALDGRLSTRTTVELVAMGVMLTCFAGAAVATRISMAARTAALTSRAQVLTTQGRTALFWARDANTLLASARRTEMISRIFMGGSIASALVFTGFGLYDAGVAVSRGRYGMAMVAASTALVPLGLIGVYALRGPRAPRLPRAMRAEIASWESGTPVPDAPPVIPEPGGGAPPAPLVRGPAPVTPTAIPEPAGARPAAVPEPAVTRPAPVPEVAPTRPRGITIEEPPGLEVNSPGDLSNPSQLASYLLQLERARGTARAQMLEGLPPEARAAVEAQLTNDTLLGGRNGPLSQLPAEVRAVVEPLLNDAEVMAGLRALESGRRALLPRDVIRSADRIGGMGEIHPEVLRMLEGGRQAAELQLTVDGDVIVTRPGAGRRGTYRAAGPEDAGAPRPAARRTTDTGTGEPAETTAQPPVQEPAARQEPTGWRRFLSRFSRRDRRRRRAYDEGAQAGRLAGRRGASDDPTTSDQYSMYRGDTADGTSRVDEYSRGFREGHRLGTREREVLGITDDSGLSRVEQSQVASTPEFQSLCERTGRGLGDQLRRTALQEGETLPTAEQPIPAEMGQRLVTHYQNMIEIIRALYAASMARAAEGGNALPLENIIAKLYAFPEVRAAVRAAAASPETTGVTPEMLRNLESTMTRYNLELLYRANRRVLDSVSRISPEELARLEAEDGSIPRMFTADEMGQIIEVLENGASSRGGYVPLSETVLRLLTPRDAAPAEVTPEVRLEARARLPVRERAAGDVVLNELRLVEPVEIGNRALEWDGIQTVLDNIYIEGIRSGQTEPNGVYQALVRALSDILNSRPEISAEDALRQAVRQSAVEEAVIAQYGEAYRQTRTRAGERPRRGPLTDAERAEGQRMWRQLEEAVESTDPIESLRTLIQEDSRRISLPRDRHPGQDIIDFAEAVRDSDLHIEMRGREIYVDRTNQLVQATGPEAPTIGEVRAMADWIVGFWQRWSGRAVAVGRWGLYGRFRSSIPVDRMAAHAPPEPGRIARRLPARVRAAIPQNVEQLNIFFGREGGARGWSLVGPTAVWAMMGAGLGAVVWYAMSGPGADERGREWLSGVYQREAEAMSRRYNLRITGPELEEAVEAEMRRSGLARVEISEENAELLDSDTELRAYIIEGLVIRPPTTEVRVSATVGSIETAMGQLRQRLARERPVVDPQRLDELITDARQTLARLQERREEIHRLLTRIHGEDASLRTAAEQRLRQVCQELGLDYARVSARTSMTRLTYSDVHIFRSPYWIQQNYLLTFSDFMARAFAEDTGIAERDSRGRLTERSRRDIEYLGSHPETFVFLFQGYMEGRIPRAMIPYALRRLMPARATATTPAFAGEPAHIGPRATPLTEAEISRYQETFRSRLQMDGRLHLYLPDDVLPIQGARVANNFMNQLDFQTIGNPQMRSQFIAVLRRYRGHPEQWERLINFTLPANYGIYGDRLPSREALRLWQLEPGRGFARMAEIIVSHEPEEARRLLEEAGYIAPRISHREGEGQHLYQWDSAFRWDREAVRYVFEHSSPGRDSGLAAWLAANHRAIAGNEYEIVRYLMRNVTPAVAELPPAEFQARISELVGTRETPGPLLPFWDSQVPTPLEGWTPTTERRETPMFGYTATPGRGAPIRGIEEEIQADLRSVGGEGTNTISRYMQDGESEGIRRYLENQIVTLARYYLRPGARQEIGNELVLRSILVSGTVESPIIVPIADMPNLDSVVRLIRRDESTIEQTIEQVARTLDRRIYRTEERRREIASGIVRGIAASLARIPPERRAAAIQMATRIMRRERPDRIRSFREYIHMLENQMVDSSEATIHGSVSLLIGARIAAREDLDERQREEFPGRIREIIEGNLDAWIDMPGFQRSPRRRGRGRGAVMNQVMVNPGNQAAAAEAIDREIGRLLNPEAAPAATEETTVTVNADVRGTIQTALSERRPRIAEERQTELLTQLTAMINEHAGDATWLQAAGLEVSGNEIQIASGRESAFTGWLGFEVDGLLEGE